VWDTAHSLNVAVNRLKNDKRCAKFLDRLQRRLGSISSNYGHGKGFSLCVETAKENDLAFRKMSAISNIRFFSSNFREISKLIISLPAYIETYLDHSDKDEIGYNISGQDFVIDVLGFVDIFKLFSQLMECSESLSISPWKVVSMITKVETHLKHLFDSIKEKKLDAFTNLNEHLEDIKQFKFKGKPLVKGWSISSINSNKKDLPFSWEERDLNDCLNDFKHLIQILRSEIKILKKDRIEPLLHKLNESMNLATLFEEAISGKSDCHTFEYEIVNFVQSIPHVKKSCLNFGNVVGLSKFRQLFKDLLKDNVQLLLQFFQYSSTLPPKGPIISCCKQTSIDDLDDVFNFEFNNVNFLGKFDEKKFIKLMYTEENVYKNLGPEMCTIFDVMFSKCGTECIVESYYRVMESHITSGNQLHDTLSMRTKLDWTLPSVPQCQKLIEDSLIHFFEGQKKHRWPIAKSNKENSVVTRFKNEECRLPFMA